jgi:hypothetical protein
LWILFGILGSFIVASSIYLVIKRLKTQKVNTLEGSANQPFVSMGSMKVNDNGDEIA